MGRNELARAAERIARRQHGIITREQGLSIGMSARAIDRLTASGAWVSLAPSVYALAAFPPTFQRQYKAAELSVTGSAICDSAAAALLGFGGFNVVRPSVVAGHTASHRSPLAVVRRAADVRVMSFQGIRVTTRAQTLADLVTKVRIDRWERACDDELLQGKLKVAELVERVEAYTGTRRRGVATLRSLVDERQDDGWVAPESALEDLLHRAVALVPGCPTVVWQASLPWGDPGEGRLDGYIPAWRLVLEADSRRWHARVRDFDKDHWRDNQAAALGLRVMRFTWTHLTQRLPEVVDIINQAGHASADFAA